VLFNILYKIGKNFLGRFDDNSLIFTRKSFNFHVSSMTSFDSFDDDARIAGEGMIRNIDKIFSS